MIIRILKVLIGVLLLPVAFVQTQVFAQQLSRIQHVEGLAGYFLGGVVAYLIMHLVLYKPDYFYVLGHETAHALAALLCRGGVSSFQVSTRGGSVATTKSNSFIALFPYFFPTYTILVWLAYFLVSLFRDTSSLAPWFLFLIGFSLTLHLVLTIDALKTKQSDVLKTGYLFSVSVIYILNLFLVTLILSAVFRSFSLADFFHASLERAGEVYSVLYEHWFL